MTVPTSTEVLLVDQIFWIQRKILENKDNYDALLVLYDLLLAHVAYITGKPASNVVVKPLLEENTAMSIKRDKLLKAVLRLNEELSILLRKWMDEKRTTAMMIGNL